MEESHEDLAEGQRIHYNFVKPHQGVRGSDTSGEGGRGG